MSKKETAPLKKRPLGFIKLLFFIIFLSLILTLGYRSYKILKSSPSSLPLPYKLKGQELSKELKDKIASAQVLIIGDEKAKWLERLSAEIQKQTSKNLAEPLKIINLAQNHEGLHRTLHKISELDKVPRLVFYVGGSSEFYEQIFHKKDMETILLNIDKYQKFSMNILYITMPFLAPLFYQNVKKVELHGIKPNMEVFLSSEKMRAMELTYKLYQIQLDELLRIFRLKDAKVIFITSPYNYELAPAKVCENAVDDLVNAKLSEYKALLQEKRFKESIKLGLEIAQKHPGHAELYHLLGQNSLKLGLFKRAREYLVMAKALDCEPHLGSPVFNSIQKSFAEKKDIELIDFDLMINSHLGSNKLFLDEQIPQEIYFEELQSEMIKTIKLYYKI